MPLISESLPKVIIVADGPSAKGFVPPQRVPVIAVNGAIDWIERADYFFTLDPSEDNMRRMSNQRKCVSYHAAVRRETQLPDGVRKMFRHSHELKKELEPKPGTPSWWFWRFGCVAGLSENWPYIHTGNSAYGALGLAYLLGAKRALLVGVDASNAPRISGGQSRELCHLPMLFASAMGQVSIVSGGGLNSVPQMDLEKGLGWICAPQ